MNGDSKLCKSYLVQTTGMELFLAGLTLFVWKRSVHNANDRVANGAVLNPFKVQ
jgi:hypothetical protein